MKEFTFNKNTQQLYVFVRSSNPVIKGVRAKAQKYLKSKGLHDATCWNIETEPHVNGSIVSFYVSSILLTIKQLTKDVKL